MSRNTYAISTKNDQGKMDKVKTIKEELSWLKKKNQKDDLNSIYT